MEALNKNRMQIPPCVANGLQLATKTAKSGCKRAAIRVEPRKNFRPWQNILFARVFYWQKGDKNVNQNR